MNNLIKTVPSELLGDCLQKYPNIIEPVHRTWGTDRLPRYIRSLLVSSSQSAHEFDTTTFIALNKLHHEHDMLFPQCALKTNIWY